MMIPESVSPDGLRERAEIVHGKGDQSCARHLHLAADEIERLNAAVVQAERSRDAWIEINEAAGDALRVSIDKNREMKKVLKALAEDPATPPWIHTLVSAAYLKSFTSAST